MGAIGLDAGVVELVDAPDSKSGSARSAGSTPATRTTLGPDGGELSGIAYVRQ